MNKNRGVYFIANDYMMDFAVAFLNSFRRFNPDIPLCFIPYGPDFEKVAKLDKEFNFKIFDNEQIIQSCDDISALFPSPIFGGFRKLAMWEGPFDEFIYIDIDTVVLSNLDFAFNFLLGFDFITSHSSIPIIRKWVWKDSIYNENILSDEQINYAANTGFIVSHKKALSMDLIKQKSSEASLLKDHMELLCGEQPLLNYLFVTSGRYTSLYSLFLNNIYYKMPLEVWAGKRYGITFRGKLYFPFKFNPTLLVHWAGTYKPNNFENWINSKLVKYLGKKKEMNKIGFFMPYKRLWKYYRFMKNKSYKLSANRIIDFVC